MRALLARWLPEKSFGFAKQPGDSRDIFVHRNQIVEGTPRNGATIEFELQAEKSDRRRAKNVRVLQ
ncbi:cold-shock protein [Bradyrhizobium genosp. P]|uniref:cold-shock protein n=1 Tax=Bradyrhizobium genosp. P TaxID=83641 RepID=UPI003CE8B3CE